MAEPEGRGTRVVLLDPGRPAACGGASHKAAVRQADGAWVEWAGRAALVVFPALILFSLLFPEYAGRIFWTVAIASLPLFFVHAGYYRWRRICPLAAVAHLPERLGVAGERRAGRWLQTHAYHVIFAIFLASLWLRLVATNGDGYALATFLLVLCIAALSVGLVFTGKTWCNYFCPVSIAEKLYTEPRGLRDTVNSQCSTCTACRPVCPDINEENSYWKEILLPSKRDVYFAFPGVVLAFYFYYFLQAGTWSYYFDGPWTKEPGLFRTAFAGGVDAYTAGFYFWPAVPRAVAAAVTLLAGGALSYGAFRLSEAALGRLLARRGRTVDREGLRSVLFGVAAFAAFVSFYSYAGAPTLRLVPGLPHVFQLVAVTTATVFLVRRLGRRPSDFAEETLARTIMANWSWADVPQPRDLREAFLIHKIRSRSHDDAQRQMLTAYQAAVREAVESGIVSRGEVHRLDALRHQLHISDADHERIMADLADESGGVAPAARAASPEKRLQLDMYAEALSIHIERLRSVSDPVDDAFVRELRDRYGVTADEHAMVLHRLLHTGDGVDRLHEMTAAIEWLAATIARFESVRSPAARFFVRLLRRRWVRATDSLVRTFAGEGAATDALRDALLSEFAAREEALSVVGALVSPATARSVRVSIARARAELGAQPEAATLLRAQLTSPDPYIRATAVYLLESIDQASHADFDRLESDEHVVVRETAAAARSVSAGASPSAASTIEKMIAVRSIGIFDDLQPEDLAQLARAGAEAWFTQGDVLCRAGEPGDEVFVLLDGEVSVEHGDCLTIEGPGSCIGELAVLDPAPREATVVASTVAVRTLRLTGESFRDALAASPIVAEAVVRILARRLRRTLPGPVRQTGEMFGRAQ